MRRTFRKYTDAHGIPTVRVTDAEATRKAIPKKGPVLCVNWDARFPVSLFDDPEARFLHIIRDPRDVLISGHRYHLKSRHSNERWLHRPSREGGGLSYHQQLAALPDRVSQMLFEMDGKHARTVYDMQRWPYGHPQVVDLRYEDLIEDKDCSLFRKAIESMNVAGFDIDLLVQSYWNNSLFGGIADRADRTNSVRQHVLSGAKQQWRTKLPREVAEVYVKKYGRALIDLGYASDHKWINECPIDEELSEIGTD